MPINRLITRGMGKSTGSSGRAGLITQGFGGFFVIVEKASRLLRRHRLGQSGTKRALNELDDIIVWAKLIRVNDETPKAQVQGTLKVKVNFSRKIAVIAEGFSSRVKKVWEDVRISVKRIK